MLHRLKAGVLTLPIGDNKFGNFWNSLVPENALKFRLPPVSLSTENGSMDLSQQRGDHHEEALVQKVRAPPGNALGASKIIF